MHNPGDIDHQPHHDGGEHIDDDLFDVEHAAAYNVRAAINGPELDEYVDHIIARDAEQRTLDDLRRDFVDALAAEYHADIFDRSAVAKAADKLAAALRHPSTGNR